MTLGPEFRHAQLVSKVRKSPVRRIKSARGAAYFGRPIGTIITAEMDKVVEDRKIAQWKDGGYEGPQPHGNSTRGKHNELDYNDLTSGGLYQRDNRPMGYRGRGNNPIKDVYRFGKDEISKKFGLRRVRTVEGSKVFKRPIGTVITPRMIALAQAAGKLKDAPGERKAFEPRAGKDGPHNNWGGRNGGMRMPVGAEARRKNDEAAAAQAKKNREMRGAEDPDVIRARRDKLWDEDSKKNAEHVKTAAERKAAKERKAALDARIAAAKAKTPERKPALEARIAEIKTRKPPPIVRGRAPAAKPGLTDPADYLREIKAAQNEKELMSIVQRVKDNMVTAFNTKAFKHVLSEADHRNAELDMSPAKAARARVRAAKVAAKKPAAKRAAPKAPAKKPTTFGQLPPQPQKRNTMSALMSALGLARSSGGNLRPGAKKPGAKKAAARPVRGSAPVALGGPAAQKAYDEHSAFIGRIKSQDGMDIRERVIRQDLKLDVGDKDRLLRKVQIVRNQKGWGVNKYPYFDQRQAARPAPRPGAAKRAAAAPAAQGRVPGFYTKQMQRREAVRKFGGEINRAQNENDLIGIVERIQEDPNLDTQAMARLLGDADQRNGDLAGEAEEKALLQAGLKDQVKHFADGKGGIGDAPIAGLWDYLDSERKGGRFKFKANRAKGGISENWFVTDGSKIPPETWILKKGAGEQDILAEIMSNHLLEQAGFSTPQTRFASLPSTPDGSGYYAESNLWMAQRHFGEYAANTGGNLKIEDNVASLDYSGKMRPNIIKELRNGSDPKAVVRCIVLDYIINNTGDRHAQNFLLMDEGGGRMRFGIIDQGRGYDEAQKSRKSIKKNLPIDQFVGPGGYRGNGGPFDIFNLASQVAGGGSALKAQIEEAIAGFEKADNKKMMAFLKAQGATPEQMKYQQEWIDAGEWRLQNLKDNVDTLVKAIQARR